MISTNTLLSHDYDLNLYSLENTNEILATSKKNRYLISLIMLVMVKLEILDREKLVIVICFHH